MGTYTYLRFSGQLKREYAKEIKRLFDMGDDSVSAVDSEGRNEWELFAERHDFAKHLASLPRAIQIPFGAITAYNEKKAGTEDAFSNVFYGDDEQAWAFHCDLKDYDGEIEAFLTEVAPEICERFVAEEWLEECDFPVVHAYNLGGYLNEIKRKDTKQ